MPDFFSPLTSLLGSLLAGTHWLATAIGLTGALDWVVAIALLTCVVRLALLPFAVIGARHARAAASAAPAMKELQRKYAERKDADSIKEFMAERKKVQQEHGMSALGCLPMLLQTPVFLSLYHLITKVSAGHRVGALTAAMVASATSASIAGVELNTRLSATGGAQAVIMVVFALIAGWAVWAAQRWFSFSIASDPTTTTVLRIMPWIAAGGVVLGAFVVPAGLVLYWAFSNLWTLVQQGVLHRRYMSPSVG